VKKLLFLIIFLISLYQIQAKDVSPNDSINSKVLQKKISIDDLLKEANSLSHTDNDNFKSLLIELLAYANKTKNEKLKAKAYHLYSMYYENSLQMDSSLIYMNKSLAMRLEIGDSLGLISSYFSFGNRYDVKGISDSSLHYYYKALDIAEKLNDSLKIGYAYMGIGNIISTNKQSEKAKDIYRQSLPYFAATSEIAMSWIYNNLGTIYSNQDSTDKAIELYEKSLIIKRKHNDWYGILFTNNNIGEILLLINREYEEALSYFLSALRLGQKHGVEKEQIGLSYMKVGKAYYYLKKYDIAMSYQDSSMLVGKELNSYRLLSRNYLLKSQIHTANKEFKSANIALKEHILYKDSLINEQSLNQLNQLSARYENEKKELEISNLEKDKKAQNAEIERKEAVNITYLVGLVLALVLIVFVTIAFFLKRKDNQYINKQKNEIQSQKVIVEEKNKEILDSISYAKRIQQSILPPKRVVKNFLPESFILYQPKDIVSGDFYWMEQIEDSILFAAIDCTGHGVPGAMISVICHNALNIAVKEFKLSAPSEILNKVEELVQESFSDKEENVNDGMDIALCSLNFESNHLMFSGANNPLWIIKNNTDTIETIPAIKQPIGGARDKIPFVNQSIQLQKGDSLYIFTDGYADQFGGPKGKKLKQRPFKEFILSIRDKTMEEQHQLMENHFINWRGSLEQIDDVCVIGVRI
jgi:serine phosphatase RsbU (regulator of sigma subunit)/tetratricopeptide (TPR) repeat protein